MAVGIATRSNMCISNMECTPALTETEFSQSEYMPINMQYKVVELLNAQHS